MPTDTATAARHRRRGRRQLGFTLLELMISVGIMGALGGVITTSSFAMLKAQSDTNSTADIAIEVSKSTRWLVRDVHRAVSTDLVDLAVPVGDADFSWTDGVTSVTCNYAMNGADNTLERDCGSGAQKVANGITGLQFSRSGDLITAAYTVTAQQNAGKIENVQLLILLGGG